MPIFSKTDADQHIADAEKDANQGEIDYKAASLQSALIAIAINLGRVADVMENRLYAPTQQDADYVARRMAERFNLPELNGDLRLFAKELLATRVRSV